MDDLDCLRPLMDRPGCPGFVSGLFETNSLIIGLVVGPMAMARLGQFNEPKVIILGPPSFLFET